MRLGLFGGTFDPIHKGHIAVAETVLQKVNLAKIIFIPAGKPWLKEGSKITSAEHRLKMVELAISGIPHFEISSIEIERPGSTYTVDTLTELLLKNKIITELYVIMGQDSLEDFPRWKDPARLLQLCYLVVVPRPGYSLPNIQVMEKELPDLNRRLIMLSSPEIEISSSNIRQRIERGLPFEHLVPKSVGEYIKQNRLYIDKGKPTK
jgi:nicotinate-nucleotide adenylyltransferase